MKKNDFFSAKDIFFVIAGNMIGVGVFITPGWVASSVSGPQSYLFTWMVGALIAVAGGVSYAAMAAVFPVNGGDYYYLKKTASSGIADIFASSMIWFGFPGSAAVLSLGVAEYLAKLFMVMGGFNLNVTVIAVAVLLFFLLLNLNRKYIAVNLQKTIVLLLFAAVSLFIFVMIFSDGNVTVEMTKNGSGAEDFLFALLMVYFSYIGFASVGYIAGEMASDFKKTAPSVTLAVMFVSVIYLALNYVYVTHIPFAVLQNDKATVFLLVKDADKLLQITVLVAVIGAASASLNVVLMTGGRLFEHIIMERTEKFKSGVFNFSLLAVTAIAVFYIIFNSLRNILTATTWIILLFSFLSVLFFFRYIMRVAPQKEKLNYRVVLPSVLFFLLSASVLTVYGLIKFYEEAFNGFIFISIGFFALILLFYLVSGAFKE